MRNWTLKAATATLLAPGLTLAADTTVFGLGAWFLPFAWLLSGLGLILADMFAGTVYLLMIGLAALMTGVLQFAATMRVELSLLIFAVLALVLCVVWATHNRVQALRTRAGQADEAIGQIGVSCAAISPECRGRARFQRPILGDEEWICRAEQHIGAGDRVRIISIEGQTLLVGPA